ncbi:hypothetical protein AUEXF2481DRAFT_27663 [Aureobasidium subglaciale EXF-2481]|uniref:Uncharacterized protein n=1 Tax=Aureobasidium subglaciale (strain EXF-2481) TaxID=1043005 RepID=A0A074YI77_AURSE|nr:uncharacterized protein AUEXF2481DRAFT_27663 [Aureobasidium subglaciale EXF-2481]KEQ97415.1 hypothetical protein AUEXF2481DRAFT_27663 [Aureobasidium subglaciale EXF-2481]
MTTNTNCEAVNAQTQSSVHHRQDSAVNLATAHTGSGQPNHIPELIRDRVFRIKSAKATSSTQSRAISNGSKTAPSTAEIAKQLKLLQIGNPIDQSLYRCLDLTWACDPPCLAVSHNRLLDFHCIISRQGLEGLTRLSENSKLAACIGSISFGVHHLTREARVHLMQWYQSEIPNGCVSSELNERYKFVHEGCEEAIDILASALSFLKKHNPDITLRICDELPSLSDLESRGKCYGLQLYGETVIEHLPIDAEFTLSFVALAVSDGEYPLQSLDFQIGLFPRSSHELLDDMESLLGSRYYDDRITRSFAKE